MSFVVGDNGVVTQAQKSKIRTDQASAKEEVEVEISGSYNDEGDLDLDLLNENFRKNLKGLQIKSENEAGEEVYLDLYDTSEDEKEIVIEKLPATVLYNGVEILIPAKYLVDIVEIGDYVDIDVSYTNVSSFSSNSTYIETKEPLKGWRVIGKEGSGASGTVKVISAGCPLKYYHSSGSSLSDSIAALEDLNTTITLISSETRGFTEQGFDTTKTGTVNLSEKFSNSKYVDISKGVHAFGCSTHYNGNEGIDATKYKPLNEVEELYKAITGEEETMDGLYYIDYKLGTSTLKKQVEDAGKKWNDKWNDLFVIGYSYWLGGSSFNSNKLWWCYYSGTVNCHSNSILGVRPVVSLKSGVKIDNEESGDGSSFEDSYKLKE